MTEPSSHIVVDTHFRITRKYFVEEALPVFNEVSRSISPIRMTCEIAGKTIRMDFFNEKLFEKMSKAFAHIEKDEDGTPDLTVYIWDSVSTNTRLASPWVNDMEYTYPREVNAKRIDADSFLGVYMHGEETLYLYDEINRSAYFWVYNADCLPYRISASPLRTILNWFLSKEGVHLLHGAAVGLNGKSILLTAKGGTGKSTTALACLLSGMSYLGDDYVTVKLGDVASTHSIFSSAKLLPHSFPDTFPALKRSIWNEDGAHKENEKLIVFLSELYPRQVIKTAPLHAIMIPVIKDVEGTKIVPAGKVQAMISLMPATIFQFSLTQSNKVADLRALVERTPCYFLELGRDINGVTEAVKSFLTNE